jgi:AN1-type zinc finger protein 1
MPEDHDCKNVVPLGAKTGGATEQSNKEKLKLGFGKLKLWGKSQQDRMEKYKPKPKPSSAAVRVAEMNKLKRECKGDDRVPVEKRVYLYVEAEKETAKAKLTEAKVWFSEEWSVGRMLDEAAKRLQVANLNNKIDKEEDRLRVYHVEGGRLLEFSDKVGKALVSGNTVVLLRGVGPSEA